MESLSIRRCSGESLTARSGVKLPKRTSEATGVFAFFEIAAVGRIGEKNPAFWLIPIINGAPDHDVRCSAGSDSRHRRGCHGVPPGVLDRPSAAGATLLRSRRGWFLEKFRDPFRQIMADRARHVLQAR